MNGSEGGHVGPVGGQVLSQGLTAGRGVSMTVSSEVPVRPGGAREGGGRSSSVGSARQVACEAGEVSAVVAVTGLARCRSGLVPASARVPACLAKGTPAGGARRVVPVWWP